MRSFVTGGSGFVGRELIRALVEKGHEVRALARSAASREAVRAAGAEPVQGDLSDALTLSSGMQGAELVFHAAAHTEEWDSDENFHRVNVLGTENVIAAARAAGVRRLVHISTEAVLANGQPIVQVDETVPSPADVLPGYPATKALAEERVRSANNSGLETVIVRPRFIWGRGDTAVLAKLVEGLESGRLMWISQGRYLTSTCHVANVCEGAILAAERGKPGNAYFLTDGEPVEFRWFLSELLKSQGLEPPAKSIPRWVARATAASSERIWKTLRLRGTPLATRAAIGLMGHEVTVRDDKARRELGYTAAVSMADGLAELARLPPVRGAA
jgi:nucleoside-diphosphate-sugar epimerase